MARLLVAVALAVAADLVGTAGGSAVNFRGSAVVPVKSSEANEVLRREMEDIGHHLKPLEEELRPMYVSLPKNARGNLGHQTVRFALHRFFVSKHGWYVRGLDVGMAGAPPPVLKAGQLNRTAPDFLQETLERGMGKEGTDLHGLATLAASLEDLAKNEAHHQLKLAYEAEDMNPEEHVPEGRALDSLWTFFMSFVLENNWTVNNRLDLNFKKFAFAAKHAGEMEAKAWFDDLTQKALSGDRAAPTSFEVATSTALNITKEYHSFNDRECKELRATLHSMESQRPGRVRLSVFYNKSLFTHWLFTEKPPLLKAMGTLDEANGQPHLIIPNYVTARPNCLKSSSLYAICCRNVCEDLMVQLEKEIGAPTAAPHRLADLVSSLPSDYVRAPRALPESLLRRLEEISEHHQGHVPLHGRLFAQWMHHAYPLECPFPQEAELVDPATIDAWLREAHGQVTEEEIREHVEADICASMPLEGNTPCGEESAEVPWSGVEQLLGGVSSPAHPQRHQQLQAEDRQPALLLLLLVFLMAALLALSPSASATAAPFGGDKRARTQVAALFLAAGAYLMGLLNGKVFILSLLGSCAVKLFTMYQHRMVKQRFMLPKVV